MAGELVRVSFHGDVLEAIKDDNGKVWTSLRRCCENLGVSMETQLAKLKTKPWATMMEIITVAEDGKQRSMTMIDLDTLPGWLFSIDARKVKPAIREKLVQYQREAARVLADYFFGKKEEDGRDLITATLEAALEVRRRQLAMTAELERIHGIAQDAAQTAKAAIAAKESGLGFFTVLGYARRVGVEMSLRDAQRHGRTLTGRCLAKGVTVGRSPDERYGWVHSYPESELQSYFQDLLEA